MPENFANRYQTALAAGVTSGAATGTVTSVTGVPATPFRAIISSEGANTDEIVLVTLVAGTTLTWTRAAEAVAGVQVASAHGIGATFTAVVTAAQAARWETPAGEFNVRDYGATGDGTTDDRLAIQAAIDAAGAAGGGEVYFPPGTYKLTSYQTATYTDSSTAYFHLLVNFDNITFRGAGRSSIISSVADIIPFFVYKTAPAANWDYAQSSATVYTMTAAAFGASSITLVTPANAGNFAVGDYAFIRTGQTIAADTKQPDSEVNQIVSADAGTGILTFRWPLAKGYAQEYFITGTTGRTSTSVTANLAAFGVAKVTTSIVTGLALRDLYLICPGSLYAITGNGMVGLRIEGVDGLYGAGLLSANVVRDARFIGNRLENTGTGAWTYSFGMGYATSDVNISENLFTGAHTAFLHIHEGCAAIIVSGNQFHTPATATSSAEQAISVRGRAYGVNIVGNVIESRVATGIYVDGDCSGGGLIVGNIIRAVTTAISIECTGWMQRDNTGTPARVEVAIAPLVPVVREQLAGWVAWNNQTVSLGPFPDNSVVLAVYVAQWTPFNSSGTDLVSVGYAADHTKYAANVDVSGGYQLTTPPLTTFGWENVGQELVAYYVNGGTEPTAGTCCVMVDFVRIPTGSN